MKASTPKGLAILMLLACMALLVGCGGEAGSDAGAAAPAASAALAPGTGTAVLSWSPPSANSDGSPVQLLGFVIYLGAAAHDLRPLQMAGATDTSAVIGNLPAGTHYFAVTALAIGGAESAFSNIETKTID